MTRSTPAQYHRYRLSALCQVNPTLDPTPYKRQVHALFAQWVKSHCHPRDFAAALAHVCGVQTASCLLSGAVPAPGRAEAVSIRLSVSLEPPRMPSELERQRPRHRFYDDAGDINPNVPLSALERPLNELYSVWLATGWHPRDFEVFVSDLAAEVAYELETVTALQGLGGCPGPDSYLNTPREVR